jgi:tetratricopeptide (TPR) repeat protein
LAAEDPAEVKYRSDYARGYFQRASLFRDRSRVREAGDDFARAARLWEQLADEDPATTHYRHQLALVLLDQATVLRLRGDWDRMEALFLRALDLQEEALAAAPTNWWRREVMALALDDYSELLCLRGRYREAAAKSDRALKMRELLRQDKAAEAGFPRFLARSYNRKGTILAATRQAADAEAAHRKAVDLLKALVADYPNAVTYRDELAHGWVHLGDFLQAAGRPSEAAAAYLAAQEAKPQDPYELNDLAWRWVTCADPAFRDPGRAGALIKPVVEQAPEVPANWFTLGAVHYRRGEWSQAAAALEEGLKRGPERGGGHFFLAMTLWHQGKKDQARDHLAKAVAALQATTPADPPLRRVRAEGEALVSGASP